MWRTGADKGLNFFGQFYGDMGLPIHSRFFASALINKLKNINLIPISQDNRYILNKSLKKHIRKADSKLPAFMLWYPHEYDSILGSFPKNIGYYVFEVNKISKQFIESINKLDLICTPSNWGIKILKDNGITIPCVKIPGGIDPVLYNSKIREESIKRETRFNFLHIGKAENRKGTDIVIRAFMKVFGRFDASKVRLILSIDNPHIKDFNAEKYVEEIAGKDSYYRIQVKHFVSDVRELYKKAHVGVFPAKAEGIGLPQVECMAMGIPIISSNYSGMSEYVSKDRAIVLENLKEEDIYDPIFFPNKGEFGTWMSPTVDELAEKMLWCFNNQGKVKEIGLAGEKWMHENYTWDFAADKFIKECL